MNAAEITDKLGLHSLRQRAWVMTTPHRNGYQQQADISTVYPIDLCYIRRRSLRRFGMAQQLSPKGRTQLELRLALKTTIEALGSTEKASPFP